jgi:transglutaminase-like putative cysteine protease
MVTRFRVVHRTAYRYESPMSDGFTATHLHPRVTPSQTIVSAELHIEPTPDEFEASHDPFGNPVARFAVHRSHSSLDVESVLVVDVDPPALPVESPSWETVAAAVRGARGELAVELGPYLAHTPSTDLLPALADITDLEFTPGRPVVDAVRGLCNRIFTSFVFDAGFSDVTTPLADVLMARRGVCQDFAHVACAALRFVGLPARYVSGYIETLPPPGQPKLVGADASHAWCSVWAGECGWLDFDPTNDQMPPTHHVTVGWGRDYGDVAPVRGVVIGSGGSQSLVVSVDVVSENRQ